MLDRLKSLLRSPEQKFVTQKPFLIDRIKERADAKLLFRQPSILLAILAAAKRPGDANDAWPLTRTELKPIYADLGLAAPKS